METSMKIVSGGQTGVDRAALDVGIELGLEIGGWCPRDRWAEDGRIPDHYPLHEVRSENVHTRTQRNVECSTASLILTRGAPMGGARLTIEYAESICRPVMVVDLLVTPNPAPQIRAWIEDLRPTVLNVAGPKESGAPGIGLQASRILSHALMDVPPAPGLFSRVLPSDLSGPQATA